jgi:hypothetical protein
VLDNESHPIPPTQQLSGTALRVSELAGKERLFHELDADRFGDYGAALSMGVGSKLRSSG